MRARRLLLVGLCTYLGACAAPKTAPLKSYSLGMGRAEYRDYLSAGAIVCDSEPRWLVDELSSVNGLLSRFLSSTEQALAPEALHHPQHLELLQEATGTLAPVLEVHRRNLEELKKCSFQASGAFPEIARRGAELLRHTTARLAEAPAALAAAEQRKRQQQWLEAAPARQVTARETWCSATPAVGNAQLYFARQSLNGRIEWLFCDGLVVEAPAGGLPQLIIPEWLNRRDRRRIRPQRYLDAAAAFSTSEIDRPPDTTVRSSGASTEQSAHAD